MVWWGWLIVAVLVMAALYGAVVLVFFGKVSKRVFRTFDEVSKDDPFDHPFFTSAEESLQDRVKRMTGRREGP